MPLPAPRSGESRDAFISRCMSNETAIQDFPDREQRSAVCFRQFRESREAPKPTMQKSVSIPAPITKTWEETVKTDNGDSKQRFFEATLSGLKEDRDGDIMDQSAIDGMIDQLKSGSVPLFPDHGRDPVTGERVYGWKQIMGVWMDGKQEGDKLKAIARLNNAHPDSDQFWGFLQEGMPVGLSIGARPRDGGIVEETVD